MMKIIPGHLKYTGIRKYISIILLIVYSISVSAADLSLFKKFSPEDCLSPSSEMDIFFLKKYFFTELATALKHYETADSSADAKHSLDKLADTLNRTGFVLKESTTDANHYYYVLPKNYAPSLFNKLVIKAEASQSTINLLVLNPDDGYWYHLDDPVILDKVVVPEENLRNFHHISEYGAKLAPVDNKANDLKKKKFSLSKTARFIISALLTTGGIAAAATFSPGIFLSSLVILAISLISSTVSLTEAALMSLSEDTEALKYLTEKAKTDKKAQKALSLIKNLENKVPTITLTNNAVNIPGGIAIARISGNFMSDLASSILSTAAIMIIGENVPKGIGLSPKKIGIAIAAAQIFPIFEKFFRPLAFLMLQINKISNFLIDLIVRFRLPEKTKAPKWAEEPLEFMKQKWLKGVLSDREYKYLSGLISIKSLKVRDIMKNKKHTSKIFTLDNQMKVKDAFYEVQDTFFSRIPLTRKGKPQGILLRKDILRYASDSDWSKKSLDELYSHMVHQLNGKREMFTCHDNLNAEQLFNKFLTSGGVQMAIVTNQRGRISDVITLEDMLENLFQWEILDESDHYQFKSFTPSLLRNINKINRSRIEVLKNALNAIKDNITDNRETIQQRNNIKRQISELDQPEKYLLFDTLWSTTHEGLKSDPYIYARNKYSYHQLAQWFSKNKRYKDVFLTLQNLLKAIKEDYGTHMNYHNTYIVFYKMLRTIQDPDELMNSKYQLPVNHNSPLLDSFREGTAPFDSLEFFVRVKEMAKTIQDAKITEKPSFFSKIKKIVSFSTGFGFLTLIPVAAFFLSPVAGIFAAAAVITATLSGLVSSTEAAIFSVNKEIIEKQADKGDKQAVNLMKILNNSEKYIPTMVFVNNLVNIPGGIYLAQFALPIFGQVMSMIVSTVVIMFFGEGVPKDQGLKHSEIIAKRAASILIFFHKLFSPLIAIMNVLTNALKSYIQAISFGKVSFADEASAKKSLIQYKKQRESLAEIDSMLKEHKTLNKPLSELTRKGLRFFDRSKNATRLADIIKNKENSDQVVEICSTEVSTGDRMTVDKAYQLLLNAPHSRIMIYDLQTDGSKKYFGYIFKDDLIQAYKEHQYHHPVSELAYPNFSIREPHFPAYSLLKEFFSGKSHLALVKTSDDQPKVLTLEDIIEYLLSTDIKDEVDIDKSELIKQLMLESDNISIQNFTGKIAA